MKNTKNWLKVNLITGLLEMKNVKSRYLFFCIGTAVLLWGLSHFAHELPGIIKSIAPNGLIH